MSEGACVTVRLTNGKEFKMRYARIVEITISLVFCISTMGCFSSRAKDIEAYIKPYQVNVNANNYQLQPPDEIEVRCRIAPEIDEQKQQIRPDGKVSFEGIGEIEIAGKTPQEVAEILKKKVKDLYSLKGDHPIDVRITTYRSKVYYVLGEVSSPGPRVYTGRDTLLTALAISPPIVTAWEKHIQVVRPSHEGRKKAKIFEINFHDVKTHGDTSKNVLLQEGDIVFVPPTPLAVVGYAVAELVRPIGQALQPVYQVSQISAYGAL